MKPKLIRTFVLIVVLVLCSVQPLLAAPQSIAHSVTLLWNPGVQPAGETIASWNIYRSLASPLAYTLISSEPAATLTYTDSEVVAGTSYSYVLTAVDTNGVESAYSPSAGATVPGNTSLLSVTTATLPAATVGGAYAAVVAASGGTPPYTWTGTGVPGLTLSPTGSLTGTPIQAGNFGESLTVTDSLGTTASASISVSVAAAAAVSGSGFPSGLALYWTFDGSGILNGTVADQSGNGNAGIIVGNVQSIVGELNQALNFNGSTAYVMATNNVGALTQSLTLGAWINTTNAARTEAIMSNFNAGASGAGYIFTTDQNGNMDMRIGGADLSAYPAYIVDPTVINDGKWHHVVASISFELQLIKFYVDGNLTSTTPVNIIPNGSGGAMLQIGVNPWSWFGDYFTGSIEQVQVYSRALTDSEVKSVYLLTSGAANTPASGALSTTQ